MLIANPIYDSVFKYLLEDIVIAKGLLGTIMSQEITELTLKPQETAVETAAAGEFLKIYRLDFSAIVREKDGSYRKVLIELQKSRHLADIMRFRRYLAQNYQKEDEITAPDGKQEIVPLPIVTIYFLGFDLKQVEVPVLKVNSCYYDVIREEPVHNIGKEDFIDLLNHDSYTIQIPRLKNELKTRVEKVLMVFSQAYQTEDRHQLNFLGEQDDPLVRRMVDRLQRAISDTAMRQQMDVEDEMERIYNREIRSLQIKVLEQDMALDEKEKELVEKDRKLVEKDRKLEEKEKTIEALLKKLQEKGDDA